jgi:FKBP-type peptidyl-prolyl cis-trans isomerase FkpA
MKFGFLILMASLVFFGCEKEEMMTIPTDKPLAVQESAMTETASGLKYSDVQIGSGEIAKNGNFVSVHYSGYLTDGNRFDSSVLRNKAFVFQLGQGRVIAGWEEGVEGMKVGGIRQLVIPPQLGYGERGAGGVIPPNATLIFDVQLLDVSDKPIN